MAFIKKTKPQIGDWILTTKDHESCSGIMKKGTPVQIIGKNQRGYNIEDKFGNKMYEIGWEI